MVPESPPARDHPPPPDGDGPPVLVPAAPIDDEAWEPAFDPPWLRRMHPRCLWDGGVLDTEGDFCSEQCRELYELWQSLYSRRHPGIDYAMERRLTAHPGSGLPPEDWPAP